MRVGQPFVEHPFHAGDAAAVEIGPAQDVAGEPGLRIEPLGLAIEDDAGLAERVDRGDQLGKRAAREIEIVAVGAQHRAKPLDAVLGHQLVQSDRELAAVADDPGGMDADRPGVDRPGERDAVPVDDVAAGRNQRVGELGRARAGREHLEVGEPQRDKAGDAGEQQQHQHQALIGKRKLARLATAESPRPFDEGGESGH